MAGGYRGFAGLWAGGAGAGPAPAVTGGYRSLLAFWAGGATGFTPVAGTPGVRSLLAFWMGGAAAGAAVEPPTPEPAAPPSAGYGWIDVRIPRRSAPVERNRSREVVSRTLARANIEREDRELIEVMLVLCSSGVLNG
jgi:hypothetical protein